MNIDKDPRKIVFVVETQNGTILHRLMMPAATMIFNGRNDIVVVNSTKDLLTKVDPNQVKAVVYSTVIPVPSHKNMRKWLDQYGIKLIVDIDDRWYLDHDVDPANAKFYNSVKQHYITASLKIADAVWVASKYMLKKAKKELKIDEKKLFYVPNGLEPVMDGWKPSEHPDVGEPIFGYVAAIGHQRDVGILVDLFKDRKLLTIEYKEPVEWKVDGKPFQYHMVLGSDYIVEKPKDFQHYSEFYDKINVSLAPLRDTDFNNCKSYLKAIEAGFKKRALIASNVRLYREIIENGKDGILCRSRAEWEDAVKNMTVERAKDLGEALYEKVIDKYNIHEINKVRLQSIENSIA